MFLTPDVRKSEDGLALTSSKDEPFQRRIEFHLAKNSFNSHNIVGGCFHLETLNPDADAQKPPTTLAGGLTVKKSEGGRDAPEHLLDPELSFGLTVRRIGAGLANLGNTCFLNSVLQCLTYTEPFAAYLQSGKHKSSCHTAGFCAMCAIQNHVKNVLQSTGKIVSPSHLVKNLRCISRNFRNSRQEDAHEYMVNLLESMHKCCLPYGVSSESPTAFDKSLVHKIFGGRLRSQVKCMQCSFSSNKFDPFLDLSLEIVKADSLRKALAHFTAVEQLDGGERQYQCQRCKQKVQALKQLTVHKAPIVLTIHLKRFGSHNPGQKIDKQIEFAPYLDLKPFVSDPPEGDYKYHLYGVLVHAGWSTHSGHYYCFVRTSSGMWYSLDDNRVIQVSEKTVLQQKAYMLFYARDRRNSAPKSPAVGAVHKENMAPNTISNGEISALVTRETIQKGQMHIKITDDHMINGVPAGSLGRPISFLGASLKGLSSKEVSVPLNSGSVGVESVVLGSISDQLLKDTSEKESSLQDRSLNTQVAQNGFHKTTVENGRSDVNRLGQNNLTLTGMDDQRSKPVGCRELQNKSSTSNGFMTQSAVHDNQIDCSSMKEIDLVDKQFQVVETDKKSVEIALVTHFNASEDARTRLPKEVSTRGRKMDPPRKNALRGVGTLHMGPRHLFLVALSLQRKKKHKRSKQRPLDLKNSHNKETVGDFTSSDQETSTSDKRAVMHEQGSLKSSKKRKSGRNSNSVANRSGGCGLMKGGDFDGAILASDSTSEKSFGPAPKECDVRETHGQGKRGSVQIGLMSMLMRGLQEATVSQWDDVETPSTDINELDVQQKKSIGYVADEWDEEYDRGKRKKVKKSKTSFDGHNPFQEAAAKMAQLKTLKTADRTNSGSRPFRI